MQCSQCLCRQGVLLPLVQQPSVPPLVAASSARSPQGLEENPFLSVTLRLPLRLLAVPQEFPISAPALSCVPSLPHGLPTSPHPPQGFTWPKGRSQDIANNSPSPAAQLEMFYQSRISNMTPCRNQTPLFPFPAPLCSWNTTGRLKSPWHLGLLCDKGQMISLWAEGELMMPSPSNWGW